MPSYLSMIKVEPGQAAPPMDVLRWWFTLKYNALVASTSAMLSRFAAKACKCSARTSC